MNSGKEKKEVLILLGSPRRGGNSAILSRAIAKGAISAGACVETLFMHDLQIQPCQACWGCQLEKSTGCVIQDEMQSVYLKLIRAKAWVIASPIFSFNMSAQTKLWLDRCFALPAYANQPIRQKVAIALAYGGEDVYKSGCINAIRTFEDIFRYIGTGITGMVYGSAMAAGEIKCNTQLLLNAETLGSELARE